MVSHPEKQVEPPAAEAEMRLSLENQSRVAEALHEYAEAMVVAFAKLSEVQRALQAGGLDWIDDAMPLSRALLAGFGEAHKIAKGIADDKRVSLETHRKTLAACEADLAASDAAAEELQRYNNKLDQLSTDEVRKGNNQRAVARLTRNREKMREAANVASIKHTRAFDSLQACASRADDLCVLACDVLAGTAEALRSAAAHVGGHDPSPGEAARHNEAPALAAVAEDDAPYSPFSPCFAQRAPAFSGGYVSAPLLADGCQRRGSTTSSTTTDYVEESARAASQASAARTPDECGSLVSEAPPSPGAPWARGAGLGASREAQWPPLHSAPAPPMPQKPELPGVDNPFDLDVVEEEAKRVAYWPMF